MRFFSITASAATAALAVLAASASAAPLIDVNFQEGTHGEVITTKFLNQYGFTVSANNFTAGRPDKAIIFDSRKRNTADFDLEGFNQFTNEGRAWDHGNLKGKIDLGKLLILAENDTDANGNNLVDSPDDEGNRPAGEITFTFRVPISEFGFNLVDVEGPTEFGANSGYVMTFHNADPMASARGEPATAQVGFAQFITPGDDFFDPTVKYGDHSANQIQPIQAGRLGMDSFSKITFNLGGSAAIDRIRFSEIPEPATAGLTLAAAGLMLRRRRNG